MQVDPLLRAIADPTRRMVLERLMEREHSVRELREHVPISQPAISQHLKVLAGAHLVSERREGRRSFYRARPEGFEPLVGWLAHYSTFWPDRIERLDRLLSSMDTKR